MLAASAASASAAALRAGGRRAVAGAQRWSSSAVPAYLLTAPVTEVSTLGNGMRVASECMEGETATVGVWIDAGSRYETPAENGTAHFLEHMAFKGTATRSRVQLEKEIENMGGHLSAYTSREQTVYFARVFKQDVPKAMDILADILQRSELSPDAIENERGVILREMEEVQNNMEEYILDELHETAFLGTSLGQTILGPEANIGTINRDHLRKYIETHYTGKRMVVAGAGAIEHAQLAELADKHFGALPADPPAGAVVDMGPAYFTGSDKRIRYDSMPEAHVAVAFKGPSWTSEHLFPTMVMQTILGAWDRSSGVGKNAASRLATNMAEGNVCHSYQTINTCYKDTGLFGVYAVAEDSHLNDLMHAIMDNMIRLCHDVSDEEVWRAKQQLQANTAMALDDYGAVCEDIGRQMLTYGRRMSALETHSRIEDVDTADIRATADKYFNDEDHALAAIGPIWELPDYNWIRRKSYWVRY